MSSAAVESSQSQYQTITARPGHVAANLITWMFFAVVSGVAFLSEEPDTSVRPFLLAVFVLVVTAMGVQAWIAVARRVVASPTELRWRWWWNWKQATWQEVSDYYLLANYGYTMHIVESAAGRLALPNTWKLDRLKAAIRQRVTSTHGIDWEYRGSRDSDPWPRVFKYSPRPSMVYGMPLFVVAYLVLVGAAYGRRAIERFGDSPAGIGLLAIAVLFYITPVLPLLFVWIGQVRRMRAREQITIDPDRAEWTARGKSPKFIPWKEVTELGTRPKFLGVNYLVRAPGREIVFGSDIAYRHGLTAAAEKLVSRNVPVRWLFGGLTPIGPAVKKVGNRRVFSYRSREMRAMLLGVAAMAIIFLGTWLARPNGPLQPLIIAISFGFGAHLFYAWYSSAGVSVSETGLTKTGIFRSDIVPWEDIRAYFIRREVRDAVLVVKTSNREIKISMLLAGIEELMDTISKRATQASTQKWDERSA